MTTKTLHRIRVMSRQGDVGVTWDPNDPDSVAAAEEMFEDLQEKGYSLFSGKRMTEFDPQASEVVAVPPMAGG